MAIISALFCRMAIYSRMIQYYPNCVNVIDIKAYDPTYGETWMFFPDGNGNPQVIDLPTVTGYMKAGGHDDPDSKIFIWLYNHENKVPVKLKVNVSADQASYELTEKFDSEKPTKFLIHGWKNSLWSDMMQVIKNAYLAADEDVNLIAVDWSEMANDNNYLKSAASARSVGRHIANVIDFMVNEHGAGLDDFHLIGHSLGAHIAGYVGVFLRSGKVARITGLDPALPGFTNLDSLDFILDPSDANFVDVIHTCSGMLGHPSNLGHADFFPNNGKARQPGCVFPFDLIGGCSHGRSYQYFAESIESHNGFMALACDNWQDYMSKKCIGEPVPMGFVLPNTTRGTFFLQTGEGPKFARYQKN